MAKVTVIPPKEAEAKRLRVAAYCRVSTDSSDQLHSYAAQIRNYTELIKQHDNWELVDVYADAGTTGTKTDQRDEFNRMMSDCQKGRIDRILVKSISRFARNTHDCLIALRKLMQLGISIEFEEDHIDTGMLTNEMLVSISGALAQQESVSISQNLKMSYKRRMERGEFITNKAPFGYRLINKRELEIDPEKAEIVKWIFASYLSGRSLTWIAEQLTQRGIKTPTGYEKWCTNSVAYVLRNEKYIGDTLCQKTFKTGFPYATKINQGEQDQYYIEYTHPAIIDRDTFEAAQKLLAQKNTGANVKCQKYLLTTKIICGKCGTAFVKIAGKQASLWCCKNHIRNAANCPVKAIPASEIYAAFVRMYNKLKLHIGTILHPAACQLDELTAAMSRSNSAILEINKEIAQISEQNYKVSQLRARGLIDTDIFTAKVRTLNAKITELRLKRQHLLHEDDTNERAENIRQVIKTIETGPERLNDFDELLFEALVETITAESQTRIRFKLYGGLELTEQLRGAKQW